MITLCFITRAQWVRVLINLSLSECSKGLTLYDINIEGSSHLYSDTLINWMPCYFQVLLMSLFQHWQNWQNHLKEEYTILIIHYLIVFIHENSRFLSLCSVTSFNHLYKVSYNFIKNTIPSFLKPSLVYKMKWPLHLIHPVIYRGSNSYCGRWCTCKQIFSEPIYTLYYVLTRQFIETDIYPVPYVYVAVYQYKWFKMVDY